MAAVLRLSALYPLAWLMNEALYDMLFDRVYNNGMIHYSVVWLIMDFLGIACTSTTYYLSWSVFIGEPSYWPKAIAFMTAAVMAGSIWRTVVNYRKGGID